MMLDEAMEQRITAIVAEFAKRMTFDPEGMRDGTRKQAMVPDGAVALDPAGTAPGLVVPGRRGRRDRAARARRASCRRMWPAAIATDAGRSGARGRREL